MIILHLLSQKVKNTSISQNPPLPTADVAQPAGDTNDAQATGAEDDTNPNGQQAVKLMPWITLIVLVSETRGDEIRAEFTEGAGSERNLPRHIVVDTSALPDLEHAWRWAHVHVTGEANLSQEALAEILRTQPERAVCRLLCPRRLRPGTRYTAFVVPTFKLGVRAGRGEALDVTIDALQPAWNPGDGEIELPYYYRWEFGTGMRGDFEHLVRLLEPRQLSNLGTRDIDCKEPGFIKTEVTRPGVDPPEQDYLGLEGALQALDTQYTFWGMDPLVEMQETALIRDVEVRVLPSRTAVRISWRTTEDASSHIEYGESEDYGSSATPSTGTGQNHQVTIEGLIADQAYHFKIVAQTDGGTPVATEDGIFQLPGRSEFQAALADLINRPDVEDKMSPVFTLNVTATEVIDNIAGTVLFPGNVVQITWHNAAEPCTSVIEYGVSDTYDQIAEPTEESVTEHKFTLEKLVPGQTYHFKIVALAEDGTIINETQDGTFRIPVPWVVPPIYGRWHYGRFNKKVDDETSTAVKTPTVVDADNQAAWIDVLNLDPRHRTAAGFGAEVVRQQQEGLMASAWEQLGAIESANDILRRAQFGRDASVSLFRRLEQLPAEAFLLVTQAAQKRVLVENPQEAGKRISAAHFLSTQTRLREATRDPAFRHITRARGPIRRRQGAGRSDDMLSRLASGDLEAAVASAKPLGTPRLCDITRRLPDPVRPGPSAPSLYLVINPAEVPIGGSAELEWEATNATSCTASGDWLGSQPLKGKRTVGPISEPQTYTLTCVGPGGGAIQSVTVGALERPTLKFTANPTKVPARGSAELEWKATNATSCTASGDWLGSQPLKGKRTVGPISEPKTYTLTCVGPGGSVEQSVEIRLISPPNVILEQMFVPIKNKRLIRWKASNADTCTASSNPPTEFWSGQKDVQGSTELGFIASTITLKLTCDGPGGTGRAELEVSPIIDGNVLSIRMTPSDIDSSVQFCDGHIECQQLTEALDNYNPFADVDLPDVPDPETMGEIVCSTLENWLDKEDDVGEPEAQPPGFIQSVKDLILPELDPNKTILDRTKQRLRLRGNLARRFADGYQGDPLDPLRWAPNFPQPMYEPLRDISHELLLPGVERIRQNTIGLLKTNRRFMESYMCGLNHEFAGELLWRGYPTDQRGSYFRQFWDVSEYVPREAELDDLFQQWLRDQGTNSIDDVPVAEKERILRRHLDEDVEAIAEMPENDRNELVESFVKQEQLEEMLRDIKRLITWSNNPLGRNQVRPTENLVLVIRGDLLKRYPNALIYAVDAVPDPQGEPVPALAEYTDAPGLRIFPTFRATLPLDLTFFGFPFDENAACGNGDDLGKYFILEQRVTEPRFGLDVPTTAQSQTDDDGSLASWDDLSWSHFELGQDDDVGKYLDEAPASAPVFSFTHDGKSWKESTSSATRASITLQKPVRIALHAREILPGL